MKRLRVILLAVILSFPLRFGLSLIRLELLS